MSTQFVNSLRARRSTIRLAPEGAPAITIRVEMPEVWDVVRIIVAPTDPILAVKVRALEALFPEAEVHQDFILKFRGWEILDEAAPLAYVGLTDGTILQLTHSRPPPVL